MKKFIVGAIVIGAFFAVSGCVSGQVQDKRAPGVPGRKTFQIQVRDPRVVGPYDTWVTVPERVWDKCDVDASYPACAG